MWSIFQAIWPHPEKRKMEQTRRPKIPALDLLTFGCHRPVIDFDSGP
jgi:hypothetical protein